MILVKGQSTYSSIERLFPKLDDDAESFIDSIQDAGYVVSITNLPSHIDTPQAYAMSLLDLVADMYQDKNELFN